MSNLSPFPFLTREGVVFIVKVGSMDLECLISRESLVSLSLFKNIDASDAETMDIYRAFETTIHALIRGLVKCDAAGPASLEIYQDTMPQ